MQENLNSTIPTEFNEQFENSLRDLLEKILGFFEQLITTKEEIKFIEDQLNDYDSLLTLISIIKKLFLHLKQKITDKYIHPSLLDTFSTCEEKQIQSGTRDYELLEKLVQKYEGEIRNHIRIEQQLKLYGENLQIKLDESEKMRNELFESSKTLINNIKRDNNDLVEKLQNLNENYLNLEKKKKKVELDKILLENQMIGLGLFPYRFQSGEKTQTNTLNSISNYHNNDTSFQQVNLEFDYAKKEKTSQKNVINKTPEKFPQKKKNFSPQTLLNNLINNQKKERNTITDCLKLKIEIARGSNDLNSKNVNMASSLNKQRIQSFPVNNKSVEENLFHNKKPTEKKENNNQQNKPNFHNTSLGLNQSSHDLDRGIIKTRSKSSHSKNNYSFNSVSKKQNEYNNRNKKDNISHFPQKEKSDFKEFSINFLKLKNSFCNK